MANYEVQLELNGDKAYPKNMLPFMTGSVNTRYTSVSGASYSHVNVTINALSAKSENADQFFTLTTDGILVKDAGWYLISASCSFSPSAALNQCEILLNVGGQPAYVASNDTKITQAIFPIQPVYIPANTVVKYVLLVSAANTSILIYERSMLSLIKIG